MAVIDKLSSSTGKRSKETNKAFAKEIADAEVLPMLFDELKKCPDKQLAQYAEKSCIAIDNESKEAFLKIINLRLKGLEKQSQIKRVQRVLKEVEEA